jgi:hypothetical protein
MSELDVNSITFGKYINKSVNEVLLDRQYCRWLIEQAWFKDSYPLLYNRIRDYNPLDFFIKKNINININTNNINTNNINTNNINTNNINTNTINNINNININTIIDNDVFINSYEMFNLISPEKLPINLSEKDMACYKFYYSLIFTIKDKIINNTNKNKYDIKAPTNWLKKFESDNPTLTREDFKNFIGSYDLPNIPYIIERIKKEGGIVYNGANSFKIAKMRSDTQELWWYGVLKEKYGEDISSQFKYMKCIFDFINIKTNTIYECKLGMKDFNDLQFKKYKLTLGTYNIVYLIGKECIIDMNNKKIYKQSNLSNNTSQLSNNTSDLSNLIQTLSLSDNITSQDIINTNNTTNTTNTNTINTTNNTNTNTTNNNIINTTNNTNTNTNEKLLIYELIKDFEIIYLEQLISFFQ